jgi:hypothetical protein
MNEYQLVTCSPGCASALREDTRAGLIYGPFRVPDRKGGFKFGNRVEWAAYADQCLYCSDALPRGRAKRLNALLDTRAAKLADLGLSTLRQHHGA